MPMMTLSGSPTRQCSILSKVLSDLDIDSKPIGRSPVRPDPSMIVSLITSGSFPFHCMCSRLIYDSAGMKMAGAIIDTVKANTIW